MSLVLYSIVGLIASLQDIRKREVSDLVHISIVIIGLLSGLSINRVIACIIAFSLFILPNLINEDAIGGADIKFMAASGLILGSRNILIASGIGVSIAMLFIIFNRVIKKDRQLSVPLIPYLFTGCMISISMAFF